MSVLVLLFSVLAVYVSCRRSEWVWTMLIGCSLIFDLLALNTAGNITVGSLQLRATDPALFGIFVGTVYLLYRSDVGVFKKKPLAFSTISILIYIFLKILWTLVFGQEELAANQVASHALGGLVASVGEVRDDLLAFLIPIYVYVAPRSRNLKAIALPLVVAIGLILMRAIGFISVTGHIWSNNAEFRYINAQQAVDLTVLGFIFLFLKVPRVSTFWSRSLAVTGLLVATVANHRSQWIALAAGGTVLALINLVGRPFIGYRKINRLVFSSILLLVVGTAAAASALQDFIAQNSVLSIISVRLYAITEPKKDADANWRQAIWHDRVRQVGGNWPWGRLLGDRRLTLFHGVWLAVPDHSAYVTIYEIGGVILCCLIGMFWLVVMITSFQFLKVSRSPEEIWPSVVALALTTCSLAFGSAYDFPLLCPAFCVVLLLHAKQQLTLRGKQNHFASVFRTQLNAS